MPNSARLKNLLAQALFKRSAYHRFKHLNIFITISDYLYVSKVNVSIAFQNV